MPDRLTQIAYEALAPEVRPLADDILKVSSAALGGPYNALLRSPDMARRCFELLDYLRFRTSVGRRGNSGRWRRAAAGAGSGGDPPAP